MKVIIERVEAGYVTPVGVTLQDDSLICRVDGQPAKEYAVYPVASPFLGEWIEEQHRKMERLARR